jgi:hypothetical protein
MWKIARVKGESFFENRKGFQPSVWRNMLNQPIKVEPSQAVWLIET